jgi:serine/arginine repetitive matrix protein 2
MGNWRPKLEGRQKRDR